jgi:Methyltransferase domain
MVGIKSLVRKSRVLMNIAVPLHRLYVTVMARWPLEGSTPDFSGHPLLIGRFRSKADYDNSVEGAETTRSARRKRQEEIAAGRDAFAFDGFCALCGSDTVFNVTAAFSPGNANWRESTFCRRCKINSRMRYSLHVLFREFTPKQSDSVYISEMFTRSYRWLKGRLPNIIGSEYLSEEMAPGSVVHGIRHENMENLSFENASLDYLLSFEVMEHLPNIDRATAEMARVVKQGGRVFFTAPFRLDADRTIVRASMDEEGYITHHLPPEMHGNPTDPAGGALCYRHFGWNYLKDMEDAGFRDAEVITFWSEQLGYLASPAIITAVKA